MNSWGARNRARRRLAQWEIDRAERDRVEQEMVDARWDNIFGDDDD